MHVPKSSKKALSEGALKVKKVVITANLEQDAQQARGNE